LFFCFVFGIVVVDNLIVMMHSLVSITTLVHLLLLNCTDNYRRQQIWYRHQMRYHT